MRGETNSPTRHLLSRLRPRRWRGSARLARNAVVGVALSTLLVTGLNPAAAAPTATRAGSGLLERASAGTQLAAAPSSQCTYSAKLVPSCRLAFGAYSLPANGESQVGAFASFEKLIGRQLDIVHVYHRGRQKFPTASEKAFVKRPGQDRLLLVNWKPENGLSWAQVAAGKGDAWIDAEAAYLKSNFSAKFYLTIHHEPEEEVNKKPGSGYTAANYRTMYQHVVNRFRKAHVTNAVYVMNYMGAQKWAGIMDQLWPGKEYVDWIAFDPYMTASHANQTGSFGRLMNLRWGSGSWQGEYHWAAAHHGRKPVMLAEWGIGEKPGDRDWKASFFRSVTAQAASYPQLKALVYFSNAQGASGDARANTSATSLASFKEMAKSDIFLPQ